MGRLLRTRGVHGLYFENHWFSWWIILKGWSPPLCLSTTIPSSVEGSCVRNPGFRNSSIPVGALGLVSVIPGSRLVLRGRGPVSRPETEPVLWCLKACLVLITRRVGEFNYQVITVLADILQDKITEFHYFVGLKFRLRSYYEWFVKEHF